LAAYSEMGGGELDLRSGWDLYRQKCRVASFRQWPFASDCSCTPDRMAAAGFIHCPAENAPDVAQCFFCFKELEGWEPSDDSMAEHKKHSPRCAFLALQKEPEKMTLLEFLKLDKERMKNLIVCTACNEGRD
uniref:Baculoviral IAP repeat containing 5 n=1 Tax=Sphenodon punctatus TaxID=8508 RepID=A0A8D0H609_SPHPU